MSGKLLEFRQENLLLFFCVRIKNASVAIFPRIVFRLEIPSPGDKTSSETTCQQLQEM